MKKIIYSFLFLLPLAMNLKAQTVSYRVTKDDPYDIKNLTVAIDPLFADISGQNGYSLGWGLRADYTYAKKFTASFDFRNAFGTRGYDPDNINTRNYFAFEGKLGLVLSDKSRSTNFRIILSKSSYSSGGYTYTSTKYFMCPGTTRSAAMFNIGLVSLNNSFQYGDSARYADGFTFKSKKDGHTFTSDSAFYKTLMLNTSGNKNAKGEDTIGGYYGGFSMLALTAGFNFRTIHQLFVDVDGWGPRANSIFSDFYIDFMFAPAIGLKNYTTKYNNEEYDVKAGKKRMIGWRMGWFIRQPKNQGFSQKFEFGQRPGIKTTKYLNGMYLMYTFGLYIPLKVGPNGAD